jgi:hypothetical protein
MSTFLRRSSLLILNQSSIPTLIRHVQKGGDNASSQAQSTAHNAQVLLTYISKHCPAMYKSHISELTKGIADERRPTLVEVSLQALSAVVRWDDKLVPSDKLVFRRSFSICSIRYLLCGIGGRTKELRAMFFDAICGTPSSLLVFLLSRRTMTKPAPKPSM